VNEIGRTSFGRVDRQFTLVPSDILSESSIDVAVGNQSRALLLPPLVLPAPPPQKICRIIFRSNDNDQQNFTLPMQRNAERAIAPLKRAFTRAQRMCGLAAE
jgi:hypothetical protein